MSGAPGLAVLDSNLVSGRLLFVWSTYLQGRLLCLDMAVGVKHQFTPLYTTLYHELTWKEYQIGCLNLSSN